MNDRNSATTPPLDNALWVSDSARAVQFRRLGNSVAAVVLLLLVSTAFLHVDELARARGEVRNVAGVQLVQTEEGGSLIRLLVKADEPVKRGQVLARLQSVSIDKELAQVGAKLANNEISTERLRALVEDRALGDLDAYSVSYPRLLEEARLLDLRDRALVRSRVGVKQSEVERAQADLMAAERGLPPARRALAAAEDIARRYEEAAKSGVVSLVMLSQSREQLANAEQSLRQAEGRVEDLRAGLRRARQELEEARNVALEEPRQQLVELAEQRRLLMADRDALTTRRGQRDLVAPVDGFVKSLPETREGAVVAPGGAVFEIVPSDDKLRMEVQVLPRDIGFVKLGQRATVKVDAFDYSRFGAVQARVSGISPTSLKNPQNGAPYYRVELTLDQPYVGQDQSKRLIPGMTGEADIATGRKTLFQYLTKPVFLTADTAFHER